MANIIQCASLGENGLFGNQLFQYAFAKTYANKHNCVLQIPAEWDGRYIFPNIQDPPIRTFLPLVHEHPDEWFGQVNIDLRGHFTTRKHSKYINSDEVKTWFQFDEKYSIDNVYPSFEYNAVHLRRGAMINLGTISKSCVDRWIQEYNCNDLPTIYLSDDPHFASNKQEFGIDDIKFDYQFIQDFLILKHATNMFRTNSSFSWWAGELSTNQNTYSPPITNKLTREVPDQFVDFIEGNHAPLAWSWFMPGADIEKDYEMRFGED